MGGTPTLTTLPLLKGNVFGRGGGTLKRKALIKYLKTHSFLCFRDSTLDPFIKETLSSFQSWSYEINLFTRCRDQFLESIFKH